jgi:predicted  nucleic acid-binding Zn ribbon protein
VKHGETRNRRIERKINHSDFNLASGEGLTVVSAGSIRTVEERYCAECGKWVECTVLNAGFACCPKCGADWNGKGN